MAATLITRDEVNENGQVVLNVILSNGTEMETHYSLGLGYLCCCVKNSSHHAWRGMGKVFWDFEKAKKNYKSAECRGVIELLQERVNAAKAAKEAK